jgi:hypothetical protein
MRRVGKIQLVGNFRNRQFGVFQQGFCFHQQHIVDKIARRFARLFLDCFVQMIGRNGQQLGIIRHLSFTDKMLRHELFVARHKRIIFVRIQFCEQMLTHVAPIGRD